jgi:hypothetical protein
MTELQTYFLFQIDSIINCINWIGFFLMIIGFGFCSVISFVVAMCVSECHSIFPEPAEIVIKKMLKRGVTIGFVGIIITLTSHLMPDRNTIIAMNVIPAITSEKAINTMTDETGEIYDMFKDWIKTQIKDEAKKELEAKLTLQKSKK